jgi:hypothetical protein
MLCTCWHGVDLTPFGDERCLDRGHGSGFSLLDIRVKNRLSHQRQFGPAVHHPFDEFELVDVSFDHSI